jgi:hypothetical protein
LDLRSLNEVRCWREEGGGRREEGGGEGAMKKPVV